MEKQAEVEKARKSGKRVILEYLFLFSPVFAALIIIGISFPAWTTLASPGKMAIFAFGAPAITSFASFAAYAVAAKKQTERLRKIFLSIFLPLSIGSVIFHMVVVFSFSWLWFPHLIAYMTLINALVSIGLNSLLIGYFRRKQVFQIKCFLEKNKMFKVKTSQKLKKIVVLLMTAIMTLGTMFMAAGCSNGKTFDVDGWTLFRYNGNFNTERGRVNIVRANSESLVVDGVLTIPAKIGKYEIYGFGGPGPGMYWSGPGVFKINLDIVEGIERIVIAAELHVDEGFWGISLSRNSIFDSVKYVEFLCNDFVRIESVFRSGNEGIIYIIPDGSMENFIERFGEANSEFFTVIEKSKYLEDKNNV